MIKEVFYVCYTNSNCSDIWDMFHNQQKKYTGINLLIISDKDGFSTVDKNRIYCYNNDEDYWGVWVNALEKFNIENFIYLQEDFILYNQVNDKKILDLVNYLNTTDYSFIRLIKSGNLNTKIISENIYEIESSNNNIFSMQPTIWKTQDYVKIMKNVMEKKWLETENYQSYMKNNNIKGLYYFNDEPKRGLNHYDSELYPYIATALVKGKWNLSEYNKELMPLIDQYNINLKIRGTI
jgi:hypothetical protein